VVERKEKYNIKRPKFIVFTDKDGTLNLEDKLLNNILNLVTTMEGMVIPITGRTVGDIESDFKKRKIKVPEIIVGDNGANIYHAKSGEFLVKRVLDKEKVLSMVREFIQSGGNKENIRYTNGRNIFATNNKEVKEYYKNSKMAILCNDIYEELLQAEDITKITLAGSKEEMEQQAEIVGKSEFWSDINPSKFPKKEYQHYILDIAQKDVNKGEAVKAIVSKLKPQYGYLCIGNGYNDISMFKTAINDGMTVAIMENSPLELIEEVKQYSRDKKQGKVMIVPANKDLANRYILGMSKVFQTYIKTEERKTKINKRLPNVQRIETKEIENPKNINNGTRVKPKNKER
jgi:HAD superfamily hydrolase (TIGR01484 family)